VSKKRSNVKIVFLAKTNILYWKALLVECESFTFAYPAASRVIQINRKKWTFFWHKFWSIFFFEKINHFSEGRFLLADFFMVQFNFLFVDKWLDLW